LDNRLQNHLLDEIESLKALNTELINQVKTLESQPPPKFSWTESNIEKFAVELNADSTFQEIANELHIKSEQWDYVFENINQPLGVSRKGIIRDVNQMYVEQFGYERNELIGKPILDFIHPDEHKELKEVITSERSDKIWRVMKKNGHYCRVHIQRQAFGDPDEGFSVALMECVEKGCPDCT
jgi:PAS domain S-box-containing protein